MTGAASGIGQAVALELAERGAKAVGLVDLQENVLKVARMINDRMETAAGRGLDRRHHRRRLSGGGRSTCFAPSTARPPCAFPPRASPAIRWPSRWTSRPARPSIYPIDKFRLVMEVNLVAPVYWAMEMMARIAEHRKAKGLGQWQPSEGIQGTVIFIGSISSQGIPGPGLVFVRPRPPSKGLRPP